MCALRIRVKCECECKCECKGQPEKTHLLVDAASALFYSVDESLSDYLCQCPVLSLVLSLSLTLYTPESFLQGLNGSMVIFETSDFPPFFGFHIVPIATDASHLFLCELFVLPNP